MESSWEAKIWIVSLALQLSLLDLPVCQGFAVLGGHSVMGRAAPGPGVAIPGLDWVLWIIHHCPQ